VAVVAVATTAAVATMAWVEEATTEAKETRGVESRRVLGALATRSNKNDAE